MPTRKKNKNPACWTDDDFRVFISHLTINKAEAQELKKHLQSFAISGFVAHSDIEPSKEWQKEIELSLRVCEAFTALLVPNFHASLWTDQEVGFAVCRDIPVFPVNLDNTNPYGFLGKYQAVRFVDTKTLAKTIFSLLLKNTKVQKKLAHALLKCLADSTSFSASSMWSGLLDGIDFWDENLIKKLNKIFDENDQVYRGSVASHRIKEILSKFGTGKLKNGRSLSEVFPGKWFNNYRHHSGRGGGETVEIKNNNEYYANDKLTFMIDQVEIGENLKTVKFRKTRIDDGSQSINNIALIRDNVYSGVEAGTDGVSEVKYKKLKN